MIIGMLVTRRLNPEACLRLLRRRVRAVALKLRDQIFAGQGAEMLAKRRIVVDGERMIGPCSRAAGGVVVGGR